MKLFKEFGFEHDKETKSIYPYSPVYKLSKNNKEYILKKTRDNPFELIKWTKHLESRSIKVVTPVENFNNNPRFFEDDMWVIYPFINGRTCNTSNNDLYKAGELLGKIHSCSENNKFDLPSYDWEIIDKKEMEENLELISKKAAPKIMKNLNYILNEYYCGKSILQECKKANLPFVTSVWDYKASNIIYETENNQPFLIDPDSSGNLPRIFDLAIPVFLFHNDNELNKSWNNCVFSIEQWDHFYEGYKKHIKVTLPEKKLWLKAMKIMFIDEAIWLLANDEDGWVHEKQSIYLKSLLNILDNLESYSI